MFGSNDRFTIIPFLTSNFRERERNTSHHLPLHLLPFNHVCLPPLVPTMTHISPTQSVVATLDELSVEFGELVRGCGLCKKVFFSGSGLISIVVVRDGIQVVW